MASFEVDMVEPSYKENNYTYCNMVIVEGKNKDLYF